mmetsp:Transcript_52504/g.145912  ORF Transcript_52504/g.145912 Transcript_52504/m.145912 type:complete len:229 (-) Transcript_52504:55-741(-)
MLDMSTSLFALPPSAARASFQASSRFTMPRLSTASGVFPPRHASVGKAVVPVQTIKPDTPASASASEAGSLVSAVTTSISGASSFRKPAARSPSRETARTLHAPMSASLTAASRPTLPEAPMTATVSSGPQPSVPLPALGVTMFSMAPISSSKGEAWATTRWRWARLARARRGAATRPSGGGRRSAVATGAAASSSSVVRALMAGRRHGVCTTRTRTSRTRVESCKGG